MKTVYGETDNSHSRTIACNVGVEIYATLLAPDVASSRSIGLEKFFMPIIYCVCVQDSPNHPCPCYGPIVWLKRDDILSLQVGVRQGAGGERVDRFIVTPGATAIVDSAHEMRIERIVEVSGRRHWTGHGKDNDTTDLSEVGALHNRYLDIICDSLDENPELLTITLFQKKKSLFVQNYHELPFDRLIREETQTGALDTQDQEIVMGVVDKVFGRLARLSSTDRNWANLDRSLFTDVQKAFLKRLSAAVTEGKSVQDVEDRILCLTPEIAAQARDREEAIPLHNAAHVAIASYAYWSDSATRRKWKSVLKKMFPSLSVAFPPTSLADTTDADAIGAGLGAIGACLGCGYVSGGAACAPCAGKGAAAGGVAVSFVWALGNAIFD
jgi:hypothetical protein